MKQILLMCVLNIAALAGDSSFLGKTVWQVGYVGEMITHPGVLIGGEQPLFRKRFIAMQLREEFLFYRHRRNHDMLGLQMVPSVKIPAGRRFAGEFFGGVGYLTKLTNGDAVYSRSSSGAIEEKSRVAMPRFSLIAGMGFNASLVKLPLCQVGLYIRPTLFWEYPYNDIFLLHPALSAGITLDFAKENGL